LRGLAKEHLSRAGYRTKQRDNTKLQKQYLILQIHKGGSELYERFFGAGSCFEVVIFTMLARRCLKIYNGRIPRSDST
jgi:hypothetical protein